MGPPFEALATILLTHTILLYVFFFTPATKLSEVILLTPACVAPKYRHCIIKVWASDKISPANKGHKQTLRWLGP